MMWTDERVRLPAALVCLLALFTLGACLSAPAHPPTSLPGSRGAAAGIGMTTNFGATITDDEGTTTDIVYWPRKSIVLLSMLSLVARYPLRARCDAGGQLAIGRLGGDARCGLGSDDGGVYLSAGAYFMPWQGFQLRTDAQAGFESKSVFGFATTGVAASAFTHRYPLDGFKLSEDGRLLSGPPAPAVDIEQRELAWTTSLILGYKERRKGPAIAYLGFTFELPVATSDTSFTCVSCDRGFRDFDPGWRVGITLSVTALGFLPAALAGGGLR